MDTKKGCNLFRQSLGDLKIHLSIADADSDCGIADFSQSESSCGRDNRTQGKISKFL
jgi:hypothetical protein